MLPWWGFQVGGTSPKIRRATKNAKCQVNESTHFVCFLGFIFGILNVCILFFCMHECFSKTTNIGIKAISHFYLLPSILLRTRTKDINLESCNNMYRDGIFRLFTLQPPLPATHGLHNSWIFIIFAARRDARSFWMFQKPPALRCLRN